LLNRHPSLLGAVFGPTATGETDYARNLLHLLGPDMLVLIDRGFHAGDVLTELATTGPPSLPKRFRLVGGPPAPARWRTGRLPVATGLLLDTGGMMAEQSLDDRLGASTRSEW
jgi:hypothetical protein